MSRFVDIDTLQAQGHSIVDIELLHQQLGLDQLGQTFHQHGEFEAYSTAAIDSFAIQNGVGEIDEAQKRRSNAEYNTGKQQAREGMSGAGTDGSDKKSTSFARAISEADLTNDLIDNIIAGITLEIDAIDAKLEEIEARRQAIAEARATAIAERTQAESDLDEITPQRDDVAETVEELEEGYDAANLNHERALRDMTGAHSPDAVISAQRNLVHTEAAREAAQTLLRERQLELEELDAEIARINDLITRLDTHLGTLSEEDLTLIQEHSDLTVDRQQLVVFRDRMNDPEFRAAVVRGEKTLEDVVEMAPEELQTSVLDNIASRIESGFDYATNAISSVVNSVRNVFTRAHNGEITQPKPEQPQIATATPATTPAPAMMNT